MVNKSKFAALAGVSPAAITKACKSTLKPAMAGRSIDETHPTAVEYLRKQAEGNTPGPATGIDPLYEQAVASGKRTANSLRKALSIGTDRATKIVAMMKAAGITATDVPQTNAEAAEAIAAPARVVSGKAARKVTKKDEALRDLRDGGAKEYDVPDNIQEFADMTLREIIKRFGTEAAFCDWLTATKTIEEISKKRLANAEAEGKLVSRQLVKTGIIDPIDAAHIRLLTDGAKTIARRATAMHGAKRSLDEIEKFVAEQITSFIRPVKDKVARALKGI